MNLKNLAIKNTARTNEPKTAYIEFEGEGVVTALISRPIRISRSSIPTR